ncbi:hypothetical protein, partial [Mesorhizobium sp. M2D.F.Ca.ET.232.01.1.1]|uniref:hypothetical protein n=1 Tax=Mesorhizobium sp. M2D.F.Ca.ET.232.01.1.1 TaxID=2496670 RepID=UPI001AED2F28
MDLRSRSRSHYEKHGQPLNEECKFRQQLPRRGVDPMYVFDHQDEWSAFAYGFNASASRPGGFLPDDLEISLLQSG